MAEWAQTIISACAAAGAIAAALVTWWVYRDSKKPDVHAYLESNQERGYTLLVVENFGDGVAYDVEIDGFDISDMPKNSLTDILEKSFVVKGIPMLVPHAKRSTIVGENIILKAYLKEEVQEVMVRFSGRKANRSTKIYENACMLEVASYAGSAYADSLLYTIAKAQAKIAGINM